MSNLDQKGELSRMSKNFKVQHKVSNSIHEVYDIQYDNCGYPHFLIYEKNDWVKVSAKNYKPYKTLITLNENYPKNKMNGD